MNLPLQMRPVVRDFRLRTSFRQFSQHGGVRPSKDPVVNHHCNQGEKYCYDQSGHPDDPAHYVCCEQDDNGFEFCGYDKHDNITCKTCQS